MIPVVLERCAGIDVHRDTVVVCWMWGAANQEAHWETQKFGTTVGQLLQMKRWLEERGCQDVVVESTGVYWEPVFNVLSEEWEEVKRLEGSIAKTAFQTIGMFYGFYERAYL